ncbi:AcrR family transcriptional regulator [Paraburkholderia sp. GAS334]|jgi:AcrR family transcriptional regulator
MHDMGIAERKNRQKMALRERILDASRRIVMREGFAALSMRKIADAIEYSPATLYLHFASRDEIARALCAEGYAQLLASFEPLTQIADPGERLRALGRAYVAFGIAHPETYRLIFMEDPTYTDAALAEAADASDEAGDASFRLMVDSIDELKAAGRLPASAEGAVWAEALWATMHGIVALKLTCPVFPRTPVDTLINVAFDAWFGSATASTDAATAQPAPQAHAMAQPEPESKPRPKRARRTAAKPESPVT